MTSTMFEILLCSHMELIKRSFTWLNIGEPPEKMTSPPKTRKVAHGHVGGGGVEY